MPRPHWSLCLVLALGLIAGCGETPPAETDHEAETPDVKVEVAAVTLDGLMDLVEMDLENSEAPRTKPVVVHLWANWCPECVTEIPALVEFQKRLGDKADFVSVSMDFAENNKKHANLAAAVAAVTAAADAKSLPFAVHVADPGDGDAAGWYAYLEVSNEVPWTVVFDKDGVKKADHQTFESADQAMTWFEGALKAE